MSKRGAAKILRDAANLLDAKGWCQYVSVRDDGACCAVGSIWETETDNNLSYKTALWALEKVNPIIKRMGIAYWNDRPERTKEDVTRLFRGTARALEHGLQVEEESE